MGAAGVAATLGLYAYVNRDPLYEEPETEEFLEEVPEYEEALPEDEIPVPHTAKKTEKEKNQIKRKQNSQKDYQKEIKPRNQAYNPTLPKVSGLEEVVEEERPWYDLPKEKREALTITNNSIEDFGRNMDELFKHFFASLEAYDFKVAASYIDDLQCNPCINEITAQYNAYLSDVIENCHRQDFNSVFRKIMWMNLFLAEKQDILTIVSYDEGFNLALFIKKGNQALEAIEYCK